MLIAHSINAQGKRHDLIEHLKSVAELAGRFASKFDATDLGYWAGMWHDLGKIHPDFQKYLYDCEAEPDQRRRGPDHKRAGALLAAQRYDALAFLIAGHHGGLPSRSALKVWLRDSTERSEEAIRLMRQQLNETVEPVDPLSLPAHLKSPLAAEFFIRMLFSALVDADFLDTEKHFKADQSDLRDGALTVSELSERFDLNQGMLSGKKPNRVNQIRDNVYQACIQAAKQSPGFFRLTVPTGGGKTRSAMGFALKHALAHGQDRVIVAIPYSSIIEQTARVYRDIFGDGAVVEHHSAVATRDESSDPVSYSDLWSRLAAENWDAPLIVTTTVQLFESLFGRKTTACRKLHNIVNTVIILDEVQTLPVGLLEPILDGLRELVAHFGVTVVLCTATQPALEDSPYLKGLPNVKEIVPDPVGLFVELGTRVRYEVPSPGTKWTWEQVAAEMRHVDQVLAVVNTKNNALDLLNSLDDPKALHLSTLLCGAHRRDVLDEVNRRLAQGLPCRLVSTQVVEAGVDLDFPFVLRAMGPLDRIVQAAGRCNRERRQAVGRVLIFDPTEGRLPPGEYATATATTRNLLTRADFEFYQPENYREYFQALYQVVDTDAKDIQSCRERLDFPEVAERFRLIDDDGVSVVVHYRGMDNSDGTVGRLLSYVQHQDEKIPRWLLRRLQPYIVNLRFRLVEGFEQDGMIREVVPGLWEWLGRYDLVRGIVAENRNAEELVI